MNGTKDLTNILGEFKEKNKEIDFLNKTMRDNNSLVRYSILGVGIILILITFYDIFFSYQIDTFYGVFYLRLFLLVITGIVFFTIEKVLDAKVVTNIISWYLIIFIVINIIVMSFFNKETIFYQTLVITIFLHINFYLPNKLLNKLIINIIVLLVFFSALLYQVVFYSSQVSSLIILFFILTSFLNTYICYRLNVVTRIAYLFDNKIFSLSDVDTLTKVYHRIKMENFIKYWVSLANREENDFAVILYDIDNLGKINSTKGNKAGDFVLKKSTEILSNVMRRQDLFGRWGDDEFLIILPNANLNKATAFAQRIREKVYSCHKFGQIGDVTISVGVASYKIDEEATSIINRVSNLVKEAKAQGGNVVVTEDSVE